MIDTATFAAFTTTSLLIELTPGPNMAYLAMIAVSEGRRPGFAAVAGVAFGLAAIGLLAAAGLATFLASQPVVYQMLRWGGVVYLLWLAWDGWRDANEAPEHAAAGSSLGLYFQRGLITNLLNPKAAVFYVAVLPGFLPAAPTLGDTVTLSAIYVAVATLIHTGIVAAAATAQRWFAHAARMRVMRRGTALALVGVAIWLFSRT